MNKKLFFLLIILLLASVLALFRFKLNKDLSQPVIIPSSTPVLTIAPVKNSDKSFSSLFVPYWTIGENQIETENFNEVIYFGIKPDNQGISLTETEVGDLEKFSGLLPADTPKLLTLRMINSEDNLRYLADVELQQKIITQTIQTAREYNFNGIILDLELSVIPFDSIVKQISIFSSNFYSETKKTNLTFSLSLYGDLFYRARPFDVKSLAKNSDSIMVMAYDLHKAKGNPGPNFPLHGKTKFGYDLEKMTDDFLSLVPPEKITVIFGVYGYDWPVSDNGRSLGEASAISLNQIKHKFLNKCSFKQCKISRDLDSGETQISYLDNENKRHIVWFEDLESIKLKQEYLLKRGINSFSYWAYSYF